MATTYELIASTTLGSAAADIEFTSIPAIFDDLLLVASVRSSQGSGGDNFFDLDVRFNGDTGSNYSWRRLRSDGSGVASASSSTTSYRIGYINGSATTADCFTSAEVYIPNYAGSTNKSGSSTVVAEQNSTTAYIAVVAGLWSDTSAITSIKIYTPSYNLVANSSAFLYGITKS